MTLEILLATLAVCLVHRLKSRLGLTALFVVVGLLTAYLFVAGRPEGGHPAPAGLLWPFHELQAVSTTSLPTILVSFVLVYVLESAHAARQLIVAVALVYVFSALIEFQVDWHAHHPVAGQPLRPEHYTDWLDLKSRVASLLAFTADFVVIIATYQFLVNKLPRLPLAIPLFVALVLAMVVDALMYGTIYFGTFTFEGLQLAPKIITGVAAGVPAATYFQWQIRRLPQSERRGLFERSPLEIVSLRKEIEVQRARYDDVKKTFGRYVSPEVVDLLTADPSKLELGGEEREVTVLFADLRGYSTISEHATPTETLALLNRYFDRVNRAVQTQRGMVNNFLGDGVLAVFGAPLDLPHRSDHALRAALMLIDEVAGLNEELAREGVLERWRHRGLEGLGVRVGLHSGKVVVGNLGNEQRMDYAVIGDVVNTAARLEALCKPLGEVLLLSDVVAAELVDPALRARLTPRGAHHVKGREQEVQVHTLTGLAPEPSALPSPVHAA